MLYINASIEPKGEEEFEIVSITFMRKELEQNELGQFKYVYGGWYQDREGIKHKFRNHIYANREDNILKIVGNICLDASVQ